METICRKGPGHIRIGIFLLLIIPSLCFGAKIYTSKDQDGNLTFSDRPLNDASVVKVDQDRFIEPERRVAVKNLGTQRSPILVAENDYFGPVEVELKITRNENFHPDRATPVRVVVPANEQREMLRLREASPNRPGYLTYQMNFVPGDPVARHHPPGPYSLPVPHGKKFPITQAFNGEETHSHHPQSVYAVDIAMPEGTPVLAARSGIIMDNSNDFFENGQTPTLIDRANVVRVLHSDGTMAIYAHLKLESARFPIGKRVAAGQVIAEAGNTGFSTGSHLHFAVQKNFGMELRSIPFQFADSSGRGFEPQKGMEVSW